MRTNPRYAQQIQIVRVFSIAPVQQLGESERARESVGITRARQCHRLRFVDDGPVGLPRAAETIWDRRFCSVEDGFSEVIGWQVGGWKSPLSGFGLRVKIALPSLRGSVVGSGVGSAAGSNGQLGGGLFGGRPRNGLASGPRARKRPGRCAPEVSVASSALQLHRSAPPRIGQLGDWLPPMGARSRSRDRRPAQGEPEPSAVLDAPVRRRKAPPPSRAGVGSDLRGVGVWPSSRARGREATSLHPTPRHLAQQNRAAQPHFVVFFHLAARSCLCRRVLPWTARDRSHRRGPSPSPRPPRLVAA